MTALDDFLSQLSEAEAHALEDHRAHRCHLSEWSCTYCEAERLARGQQAPCPAWCDGTHPDPGGVGNIAHVRVVNGVALEWVTNSNGRRGSIKVKWAPSFTSSNYYGSDGLCQLAADALALAAQVEESCCPIVQSDPVPTL